MKMTTNVRLVLADDHGSSIIDGMRAAQDMQAQLDQGKDKPQMTDQEAIQMLLRIGAERYLTL